MPAINLEMADITETEDKFLNSLVMDCVIYRLTKDEALAYIASRFKKTSDRTYRKRKAHIMSDESTQV